MNYIVVIRTAGERTYNVCKSIISSQVPNDTQIYTVQEIPFEKTLRECYKIGISSNKKWMITIDSDVLLRGNIIPELIDIANSLHESFFQFEGYVFDRFFSKYKCAGIRVYRVEYLSKAINFIPENGKELRPETYIVNRMVDLGFKTKKEKIVCGIHDFEQYYSDIYRKVYVHTRKHYRYIFSVIVLNLLSKHDLSDEKKVILRAAVDSIISNRNMSINKNLFNKTDEVLSSLSLTDQNQLLTDSDAQELVIEVLNKYPASFFNNYLSDLYLRAKGKGLNNSLKWLAIRLYYKAFHSQNV